MTQFPSPVWHELDGGRYIGTGTYSITRDPEEDWLNAGAYRAMVHDKTSVGRDSATVPRKLRARRGMQSVGADQEIGLGGRAVLEHRRDAVYPVSMRVSVFPPA